MLLSGIGLLLGLCLPVLAQNEPVEQFEEELLLKPLPDGRLLSRFSFKTVLRQAAPRNPETLVEDDLPQHYTVFPLTLGQILREYAVTELHLTLNAGKWNYQSWGYPPEAGVGAGAELWAWMGDGAPTRIDQRWQGVRNALAGLFCASLGAMDEQRTTSPTLSFAPEGSLPDWAQPHHLRHATLPSEHVCTENLTPFLKLLPCKSLSGIATLLNPHKLFDADWHGMGIHVVWQPDVGVQVRFSFQAVSDPVRLSGSQNQDWSFRFLYDRIIERSCPVAKTSQISVVLPASGTYSITPEPDSVEGGTAKYNLTKGTKELDVSLSQPGGFHYPLNPPDPPLTQLTIQRVLQGSSQERGTLSITIQNNEPETIRIVYLEAMPWLLQFYLHTMRLYLGDADRSDLIRNVSYIPPVPHSRPATLQSILTIPGLAKVQLSIDVSKAFLRYTEHPPDAQRGWDLPPAVFVPIESNVNASDDLTFGSRIYTPILLADLATPDFSMPYNVIILTCSLMAFLFGSVFNLLTRKIVVVKLD